MEDEEQQCWFSWGEKKTLRVEDSTHNKLGVNTGLGENKSWKKFK